MPSHVHLLLWPQNSEIIIAAILNRIKGLTAHRYRDYLEKEQSRIFESMLNELPGRKAFRFWQAGGGFDRNLWGRVAIQIWPTRHKCRGTRKK